MKGERRRTTDDGRQTLGTDEIRKPKDERLKTKAAHEVTRRLHEGTRGKVWRGRCERLVGSALGRGLWAAGVRWAQAARRAMVPRSWSRWMRSWSRIQPTISTSWVGPKMAWRAERAQMLLGWRRR